MSRDLKSLLFGALVAMIGVASGPATAADGETAQQCIQDTRRTIVQLKNLAATSGLDAMHLNSIDQADVQHRDETCTTTLKPIINQRTAQDEMERTYLCAAKAENCAIGLVQTGMECTAAKVRCGQIYPIPK